MRITFVMASGFNMSGGDRVIEIHARALLQRGHFVQVVARPLPKPSIRRQAVSLLKGRGLVPDPSSGPSHFSNTPVPHRRIDRFRPIVADDLPDADVVIATWWETADWVAALPPRKGAKAFFIQHYEAFENMPKDRVDATWRLPLQKIAIAGWLVDLARERFGDPDAILVPNSVDTAQFTAPPRGKRPVPTIGLLDHPSAWKGVAVSLDAIARTVARIGALRLVTFGEAPFARALPEGIEHVHHRHPPQDRIRDIYAACDVWLSASVSEGFGLTCLEAMACRCPVVSTRSGGPIDFVKPGINGYLADVGAADQLAGHLRDVLGKTDGEWRAMSDAAYATARSYSWDDATDLFEAALMEAVRRRSGAI